MNYSRISTFVINLKNRTDRKENILNEFLGRDEFSVTIVEPQKDENPALSLWRTIKYIIENKICKEDEFFLLCEDDHQFTEHYQKEELFTCIIKANEMGADILSGGVGAVYKFVQVFENIFWMDTFSGLQFTIIYKRFFNIITTSYFEKNAAADLKISALTENKFLIYPFISTQKEFGYSDVTTANNLKGRVDGFFKLAPERIKTVQDVSAFYKSQRSEIYKAFEINDYQNICMPTYIINLPERTDRLDHIKKQFEGRNEFDIKIIEAIKHEKGNLGLWLTIRKIVEQAIINEDDIIIICEDDHQFTDHYSKNNFIKDVIEAHTFGAGILLGGIGYFSSAALIMENKFWIDSFFCTQFTVIYRSLFKRILDEPFDEKVTADGVFSTLTSNKLVMFPFISTQKYLGHSDINKANNHAGHMDKHFQSTSVCFEKMKHMAKMNPHINTL
jgi:hypothetical protein